MEMNQQTVRVFPKLKRQTLYRLSVVGLATFITQASPGGAASSWGSECLGTDLTTNSYCVNNLADSIPTETDQWTLRKAVEEANTRLATSASIGFTDNLFGITRGTDGVPTNTSQTPLDAGSTPPTNPTNTATITLDSALEIKNNITITAPTDALGTPLLTIVRGDAITSGTPLISVNPTADSAADPSAPTIGPAANQATTEVKIENVLIQARTNTENPQGDGFATPGVTIQVKETISETHTGPVVVAPIVVLVNTTISNAVSETGGAAVNTPGDVTLVNSNLTGNVAAQSGENPVAQDGGAIKAEGTVNVISSALNGNTASGDGGAISATTVIVESASDLSNSQLNGNTAGGSGGAISATANVTIAQAEVAGNTSISGNGGAIEAAGDVTLSSTVISGNQALSGNGGAIAATGNVSASDSTFTSNQSLNPVTNSADLRPAIGGGAISAGGNVTITSDPASSTPSTMLGNTSTTNGGAISAAGGVSVSGLIANGNSAQFHGGVISAGASVSVTSMSAAGNSSTSDGGAISVNDGFGNPNVSSNSTLTVSVSDSNLSGNSSTMGSGGAISSVGTVTINNSTLEGNTSGYEGGAIKVGNSAVTSNVNVINNSVIATNEATVSGGGISTNGNVSVSTSAFYNNVAITGSGGAISAGGDVVVSASNIHNNIAPSGSGGAISAGNSVSILAGTTLNNNTAIISGGGISTIGSAVISESTLNENIAVNGSGGAVAADTVAVIGSTIDDNQSIHGSGGAISANGSVLVNSSYLNSNSVSSGSGGAIHSHGHVEVKLGSELNNNYADDNGGALSANTVDISNSELSGNYSDLNGGAIYSFGNVEIENSILLNNVSFNGGAIFTEGVETFTSVTNSQIAGNSSYFSGGAIYTEGDVEVLDSVFGIFIGGDVDEIAPPIFQPNFSNQGQGGAIYSEGNITATNSIFAGNISGSDGGAIFAEETTSITGTLFFLNQANGNGGAIMSNGDVNIANGSMLFANTAGAIDFTGLEMLFPVLYPIFEENDGLNEVNGGNGGAVYSASDVRVSGSSIGLSAPPIGESAIWGNRAICHQTYWDDSAWQSDCVYEVYEFENDEAIFIEYISTGNGGGIYALGQVVIEGGLTDTFIDMSESNLLETIKSREASFESTFFTNNHAENDGGAIFTLGGAIISNTEFGEESDENPDYNPERRFLNPDYISDSYVLNPLFGNGEMPPVPNNSYDPEVPPTIPNPLCEGANQFIGNMNTGESWCVIDENWYTTSIENPNLGWMVDFPNPLYSDEEFIYIPEIGSRYNYVRDDQSRELNPFKYIYKGNSSGEDGGAVYVEGPALLSNVTFIGNTSADDGGAIFSIGMLQISDSTFKRNFADDDGGAIKSQPESQDLLIARSAFIENVAMDDGGAIYISTEEVAHYDDLILSSLFESNEAFGYGGAIDSDFAVLVLNTFVNNKSIQGNSLNLDGALLTGNVFVDTESPEGYFSQEICSIYQNPTTALNFATDYSCFGSYGYLDEVLTREEIEESIEPLSLVDDYETQLFNFFAEIPEFYLEEESDNSDYPELSTFGQFFTDEVNKDFNQNIRHSDVMWTAGHLQTIFPSVVVPESPNVVVTPGSGSNEQSGTNMSGNENLGLVTPEPDRTPSPVLITETTLSAEELARIAQQRADQLAAELKRQQAAEKAAAERLAKIKADKLARDKARALAAEKRRAQLAALKAKIAATKARGEVLKQKYSWINLMKDFSKPATAKKLVGTPVK
jgi:predicted outer membrane repeat protein